jgi:hypothetical protein
MYVCECLEPLRFEKRLFQRDWTKKDKVQHLYVPSFFPIIQAAGFVSIEQYRHRYCSIEVPVRPY